MQSCSNNDDYLSDAPPKLKSLITSSEYVTLNEQIASLGKELKTNYKKLSESEKEIVINILSKIKENSDTQEVFDKLSDELHAITKIDFRTAIEEISEDAVKFHLYNVQNNISNKELVLAVNKYQNGSIPRLKNGGEQGDPTLECVAECTGFCIICLEVCVWTLAAMPACDAACLATYALCCLLC
jgi:hypothetical protein